MEYIKAILAGLIATLIILVGVLGFNEHSEARKEIPSGTTTPAVRTAKLVDLAALFGKSDGGACYKLADNDGDGFTFLIANNGTITGSLTCD